MDFTTPIRNQGSAGTCWAFAAVAALESKLEITANDPDWNPDLSEQHLVCDGSAGGTGGGWEYLALNFFLETGIVTEQELPYTGSDTSPNWPLDDGWENRVYKISDRDNWITATTENLKSNLQAHGPLVAAMLTREDWYWPVGGGAGEQDLSGWAQPPAGAVGADAVGSTIDHAIAVVGFQDDDSLDEGGYWIVRNSWGSNWGDDGYGYILYGELERHGRVHAITGEAYFAGPATMTGDFNADGRLDALDIDLLMEQIYEPGYSSSYDLTGDGLVDQDDADMLIRDLLGTEYGDANLDRRVDAGDLSLLAAHWLATGQGWANGNFDGAGSVSAADLSLLSTHWLTDLSGATVPEPAAVLLLGCGGGVLLRRRH